MGLKTLTLVGAAYLLDEMEQLGYYAEERVVLISFPIMSLRVTEFLSLGAFLAFTFAFSHQRLTTFTMFASSQQDRVLGMNHDYENARLHEPSINL